MRCQPPPSATSPQPQSHPFTIPTQAEVFSTVVAPVVDDVIKGFNCTVFAYGQTGTGKTHTMEGSLEDPEQRGVIPRSVRSTAACIFGDDVVHTLNSPTFSHHPTTSTLPFRHPKGALHFRRP